MLLLPTEVGISLASKCTQPKIRHLYIANQQNVN